MTVSKKILIFLGVFGAIFIPILLFVLWNAYTTNCLLKSGEKVIGVIEVNYFVSTESGEICVSKGHFSVNNREYFFETQRQEGACKFKQNEKVLIRYEKNNPSNNLIEKEGNPTFEVFLGFLVFGLLVVGVSFFTIQRTKVKNG